MVAASTPMRPKLPCRLKSPTSDRSGSANGEPDSVGTDRLHPPGFSIAEPRCQIASMATATSVPATSPMRMPPRTRRTTRTPVSSRVNTNTTRGNGADRTEAAGAETDGRRGNARRADEAGVDEPDEQEEQADTRGDRELELHRHRVEDELPQARGGQDAR